MLRALKRISILLAKQYASIGGQAVIEGVMMRSPNAFVVAVRKADGKIRLRRDQWFGISQKFSFLKKPFLRGVVVLIETMANGIVSLNYSANIALDEELKAEALKKGKTLEEYESEKKRREKLDLTTFFTVATSLVFGLTLFVFVPHAATEGMNLWFNLGWKLDGFLFHFIDGTIKAFIFVFYIWMISLIPEIKKVFQYHGAEHKSIATFEAGEELNVDNAGRHSKLHPRCGTSFIFFLLFISIILFSVIFAAYPVGQNLDRIPKHLVAILVKIAFMLPVASISYEMIKLAGKYPKNILGRVLSFPGMVLQRLTTKEPTDEQLEVALCSIKAVLFLEEKYHLKEAQNKVLTIEEIDIDSINDIEGANASLKDFLE